MARSTAARLAIALGTGAMVAPALAGCPNTTADVNGDGAADVNDLMCVLLSNGIDYGLLLSMPLPCLGPNPGLVDVDCDQDVTAADVAVVMDVVLGDGLPPEFDTNANTCVDQCELGCDCGFNETCAPPGLCVPLVEGCGLTEGLEPGAAWPMMGYCPGRNFQAPARGPKTPSVQWKAVIEGAELEHVAVSASGTLFVSDRQGRLHALSRSGDLRFSTDLLAGTGVSALGVYGAVSSPLLGKDGRVFVSAWDPFLSICRLCAVMPYGEVKWCIQSAGCAGHPGVAGKGTLWTSQFWPAAQVALTQTGTPLATIGEGASLRGSAPITTSSGRVVVHATEASPEPGGTLWAREPEGWLAWSAPVRPEQGTGMAQGPGDRLFGFGSTAALSGDPGPTAFGLNAGGQLVWKVALPDAPKHSPAVAPDGTLRVATQSGAVLALSDAGKLLWSTPVMEADTEGCSRSVGQPTVDTEGTTFVSARRVCPKETTGALVALDEAGDVMWSLDLDAAVTRSHLAMSGSGALYVVSHDRTTLWSVGN
jgi:outer membrane protein assembly factor BamB